MKTCKLEILKKNRKYFAVKVNGYECKLLIDATSDKLEPGIIDTILLDDISVRTKFGTDVIYKVHAAVDVKKPAGICTLLHDKYNTRLVDECKKLGGRWDKDTKTWVFLDYVSDRVDELDELYNSRLAVIEVTVKQTVSWMHDSVYFLGYPIATATGRDSGAKVNEHVSLISGSFTSGGSIKNWDTVVKSGAVFRLTCSRNLIEDSFPEYENDNWKITVLKECVE